jgi:hypothetical protein
VRSFAKLFFILLLVVVASAAFGQIVESDYFVRTIYLNEVLTHQAGFKVNYTAADYSRVEVYIPNDWFTTAAGKAEMIYTHSGSAPYMDVYYNQGEFSHVRLYVKQDRNHLSWGRLEGQDVSARFDKETIGNLP